jgi:hypothetical protein
LENQTYILQAQVQDWRGKFELSKVQPNKLTQALPIWMRNKLKEFEELLLNNTLLKVQNQALGDKNPKWKEWWQMIQKFMEEHGATYVDEHVYQLEL